MTHRPLLSAEEAGAYRRDGQVTAAHRLPGELMASLTAAVEGLITDNPAIRPEGLAGAHVLRNRDTGVRGREEFLACARHPDLLDMVAQLLGPDLIVWGSHVFAKPAGDGRAVPWHQDGEYWGHIRPMEALTAWIAIDPAGVENGCLRVIPGSHTRGALGHTVSADASLALSIALEPAEVDEAEARDVQLEPGQVSFHHHALVHGSNANSSGRRRAGWAVRFMPATSHFDRTLPPTRIASTQSIDFANRPIWLVRGTDRADNDFRTGRDDA
jgi:ectoine hydroxylase-related dioxygenase (phytanoyl-CoA dioxygenase family)